jgi:tetratricopeptide (TPR) repeat protein
MESLQPHKQNTIKTNPSSSLLPPILLQGLLLLCLTGVIFLVYSSNLDGPFILDDSRIENNLPLHITNLSLKNLARAGFESEPSTRPVSYITFALNYYFHGYSPTGYHLVNICVHALAAIFLFLFIKATLGLPALSPRFSKYTWLPFTAALIWAVHPLQTQSVTYIIQRMNSLSAMFYILALYLYSNGRLAQPKSKKWLLFCGSLAAGVLALGSKETAATLPFFMFLYEWYFFQDLNPNWLKRQFIPAALLFLALALLIFLYLGSDPITHILSSYKIRDFTLIERLLTEFRVVIFYLGLLIFPHPSRLNLDHHFSLSTGLFSPVTTAFSIFFLAILLLLAIISAKKNRLFSFCILWFLGNLVIESSFIGLEIIFEHRNYLPSMMAIFLIVLTVFQLSDKIPWLRFITLGGVVLLLSYWTYDRNSLWSDKVLIWNDSVEKSPMKARPHNNLGVALKNRGDLQKAVEHFQTSLRLDPRFTGTYNNLGNTFMQLGKFNEAFDNYFKALYAEPDNPKIHANLGKAYMKKWQIEEAIYHYREALRLQPYDQETRMDLKSAQKMLEAQKMREKKNRN